MEITINDLNKFKTGDPFTDKTAQELLSIAKTFVLKKYNFFLKEGEVSNYWGCVTQGLIRAYYYKGEKEVTEYFASEGTCFIAVDSYFSRTPSCMFIETLEPTVLCCFHYDDFEALCERNNEVEHCFRKKLEHMLVSFRQKLDFQKFETARQRYENLLNEIPELLRRIPAIQIASYLGVTPETLSRIRSKIEK
jgi:CRP-like cAMP-binding protein